MSCPADADRTAAPLSSVCASRLKWLHFDLSGTSGHDRQARLLGVPGVRLCRRVPARVPCGGHDDPRDRRPTARMTSAIRIGVDVGGTFTDLVLQDLSGRLRSCKVPTTPAEPAAGVLNGIAA